MMSTSRRKSTNAVTRAITDLIPSILPPKRKKKQNKKHVLVVGSASKVRTVNVSAPVTTGQQRFGPSGLRLNENIVRIPFSACTAPIALVSAITSAGGSSALYWGSAGTNGFDIAPTNTILFGYAIGSLAVSFTRFRCTKLKVSYLPFLPTTTQGLIAFGYTSDAFDITPTFVSVGTIECSVETPIWSRVLLDCNQHLDKEWRYIYSSSDSSLANIRMTQAGSVTAFLTGGPVLPAISTIGYFRFEGEFEFKDLARSDIVGSRPPLNLPSTSESSGIIDERMIGVPSIPIDPPLPPTPPTVLSNTGEIFTNSTPFQSVDPGYEYIRRPVLNRIDTPAYPIKQL